MSAPSVTETALPMKRGADDWVSAMRAGQFEQAWVITDRDLARSVVDDKHKGPRHLQRIWRGEELRKRRVLVRCYHGLGDTIQFARFLPHLAEIAHGLTVWCQPELLPLIGRVAGVDRAIPLHDGTPEADFDVDIEIMEIPHAIRAGRDLIERHGAYLTLPRRSVPSYVVAHEVLAVGLVWEVGNWDKRRVIPAQLLKELDKPGIEVYSLQRGAGSGEADRIGARDISTPDIIELGYRMGELDIVVSVDTMVVHLAGALGYEPWVMLHADCDWRWPTRGGASRWYPRAKLFHQHRAGVWEDVIDDVGSALVGRIPRQLQSRALPL